MKTDRSFAGKAANRPGVILVVILMLLFSVLLLMRGFRLRERTLELQKRQAALEQQASALRAENAELKELAGRGYTEEELFDIARQRFGLVFPNEILFIPEDD